MELNSMLFIALLLPVFTGNGADWPHWRGTNRNGITIEQSGWSGRSWPGPEAWRVNVGVGGTSPLVVRNRVFASGWGDGKDTVYCLNSIDGKTIWEQSYACPSYGRYAVGDQDSYAGMSSTPEYDEATGFLYTLSIDGDLHAWSAADGKKIWHLNLYDRFGVGQRPKVGRAGLRDYGYTSSPLVYKDWLIVEVGDDEGNLMAFDKRTGERRWSSEAKNPAGHTGGLVPMDVNGIPCVAVLTLTHLLVVRLDQGNAGRTVALYEWVTDYANNIPTPAVDGNTVLITTAYNHRTICKIEITLNGARKVWEQPYASGVCSPVIYRGNVYWAWEGLKCLDLQTGELRWEGGSFGVPSSCVVTADGKLIILSNRGDLVLVETVDRSPSLYTELARKNQLFSDDVWPHVVIANGRIFCKDRAGEMICFTTR